LFNFNYNVLVGGNKNGRYKNSDRFDVFSHWCDNISFRHPDDVKFRNVSKIAGDQCKSLYGSIDADIRTDDALFCIPKEKNLKLLCSIYMVKIELRRGFASDNNAGVHPEILKELQLVNQGHTLGYGNDRYTEEACRLFR